MKYTAISLFMLLAHSAWGVDFNADYLTHEQVYEMDMAFRGKNALPEVHKDKYSKEDLGAQFFTLYKTLLMLKDYNEAKPVYDEEDQLTYRPIAEKNWWKYLIDRADEFRLPRKGIETYSCNGDVVAYVNRPERGKIKLCRFFFEENVDFYNRIGTLLHEVRHFEDDGNPHVTCESGPFKGRPGTCDTSINDEGAYAVDLQVTVSLALHPDTPQRQKRILEARAVYKAYTKFNEEPMIKLRRSLLLSNSTGDIFNYTPKTETLDHVKSFERPAHIVNTRSNLYKSLTLYPLSTESETQRLLTDFDTGVENKLPVQKHFESLSSDERFANLTFSKNYFMLNGSAVTSNCSKTDVFHGLTPGHENPVGLADVRSSEDESNQTLLLTESGATYSISCEQNTEAEGDSTIVFEKTDYVFESDLKEMKVKQMVQPDKNVNDLYAVTYRNELLKLRIQDNTFQLVEVMNPAEYGEALSITELHQAEIFIDGETYDKDNLLIGAYEEI